MLAALCLAAMVTVAAASPVALAGSETGSVVSPQREAIVGEWRAAYLPHGWIATPQTREQITEAVRELGGMEMNTQIHNIGVMDATGSVPAEMYSGLSVWVDVSRQVEPEQQIVLWVSGDTAIHVKDRSLHGSIGAWLASLVESADADGVLLRLRALSLRRPRLSVTPRDDQGTAPPHLDRIDCSPR